MGTHSTAPTAAHGPHPQVSKVPGFESIAQISNTRREGLEGPLPTGAGPPTESLPGSAWEPFVRAPATDGKTHYRGAPCGRLGMIKKIDHVGIAVTDAGDAKAVYEGLLGLRLASTDEVPTQKVRTAFYPCADVRLELLEPTSPESTVAKFLGKKGEGLHHIAFEVDDVRAELARLAKAGVELIDRAPRPGAHGTEVAFLHPRATRGVLVELVQRPQGR